MGFVSISHEDHLEQSIAQALERNAFLARNREKRVVGGELEVQQPALFCNSAPLWIQAMPSKSVWRSGPEQKKIFKNL
jgi:hypothetical protein